MKNVDIEIIPRLVKNSELSLEDAIIMLWRHLYEHAPYYGMGLLDEDQRSDFLLSIHQRFGTFITSFSEEKSSFNTYLNAYIRNSIKSWLRANVMSMASEQTLVSENKQAFEISSEQYASPQEKQSLQPAASPCSTKKKSQKRLIAERTAIILLLKASYDVSDEIIATISQYTNIPTEKLLEMIQHIKSSLTKKKERQNELIKKRDTAYFFHRKYSILLQDTTIHDCKKAHVKKLYESYTTRWKKYNELLATKRLCSPSTEAIAQEMQISTRQVYYYIKHVLNKQIDFEDAKEKNTNKS